MRRAGLLAAVAALAVAGCGGSSSSSSNSTGTGGQSSTAPVRLSPSLHLTSSAFRANGPIPRRYTCDGSDMPLPVQISGVPRGTHELLLTMRDPNAPTGNFVHWALAGIPPSATSVPASGAVQGANSFGSTGYRGPCPPPGDKAHHYVITLSALSGPSGLTAGFPTSATPKSAAIAIATLVGTYARR